MSRSTICSLSALLLIACAPASQNSEPQSAPLAETESFASAESAVAKAKAAGFLWTDTEALLAQAHKEAKAGRPEAARAMAETARFQAETATAQYDLARLKFARSNINPESLSESQLETLLLIDKKIQARQTQEALKLLTDIDSSRIESTPRFHASQNAYAPAVEESQTIAKQASPSEYQLRRVAGRPGWRSTRITRVPQPVQKAAAEKP